MKTITNVLEDFEKLAYKFLLSVIFIPKTLFQIIVNPGWAPKYIKSELKQEKSPFDEYLSPIVLLLVVAFLPAVIYGLLPSIGAGITNGPAEKEIIGSIVEDRITADPSITRESAESFLANRFVKFEVTTSSTSGINNMVYLHSWYVEKIFLNEKGQFDHYEEIYRVNYDSRDFPVQRINNNTTKDSFYYLFDEAGEYYVNVEVEKYYQNSDIPVESFDTYLYVYVPDKPEKAVEVFNNTSSPTGGKTENKDFSERLKKESNVFLALGLLFPPLLFALAAKLFTKIRETSENSSKESFYEISENSLKESFFAQCYYFSPIGLAIWAVVYSGYYLTPDIFFYKDNDIGYAIIFLPLLLAVIWFIGVETNAIARERNISRWIAFLITLFNIALIVALTYLVISFSDIHDPLRHAAVWLYLLGSAVLLVAFAIAWLKRKKTGNDTENATENNTEISTENNAETSTENSKVRLRLGEVVLIVSILLVIALAALAFVSTPKIAPSTPKPEIDLRSSSIASAAPEVLVEATATEAPLVVDTPLPEVQRFFTEEFDTTDNWSYFVVDGNKSVIAKEDNPKMSLLTDNSLLTFDLNAMNLWVYTTYDSFEYDNVRVDARVINRGVNTNNVSLICRYTDAGWYEFNIGNDGLYTILFAEVDSNNNEGYTTIFEGGSTAIKSGKGINEYTAICDGNNLSLFINGTEARVVTETKYNLTSGKIGVSVSSFDILPVSVDVDWVTISEP